MEFKSLVIVIVVAAIAIALLLSVCDLGGQPSARDHVLSFIRDIQSDSLPDLDQYMNVDSVAANLYTGPEFDTLSQSQLEARCRKDFQGHGRYRDMFLTSQVVVNLEKHPNDSTATVEVSYINKRTRIQYYTQMLLRRVGEGWTICRLRTE